MHNFNLQKQLNLSAQIKRYVHYVILFHDLLRLPILHHYVWSEIKGHNLSLIHI